MPHIIREIYEHMYITRKAARHMDMLYETVSNYSIFTENIEIAIFVVGYIL
ncbi:hypothetical protein WN48_10958 [Eufriesea mexicana]|uniref:Uncharacterized protein n=1 Tax=Eufriesea mexicana TaxID=516756 RepID=A0A310ST89_9HYME|nr:hypothetical protein WN48_10958 [Eufriesea mexicana]